MSAVGNNGPDWRDRLRDWDPAKRLSALSEHEVRRVQARLEDVSAGALGLPRARHVRSELVWLAAALLLCLVALWRGLSDRESTVAPRLAEAAETTRPAEPSEPSRSGTSAGSEPTSAPGAGAVPGSARAARNATREPATAGEPTERPDRFPAEHGADRHRTTTAREDLAATATVAERATGSEADPSAGNETDSSRRVQLAFVAASGRRIYWTLDNDFPGVLGAGGRD